MRLGAHHRVGSGLLETCIGCQSPLQARHQPTGLEDLGVGHTPAPPKVGLENRRGLGAPNQDARYVRLHLLPIRSPMAQQGAPVHDHLLGAEDRQDHLHLFRVLHSASVGAARGQEPPACGAVYRQGPPQKRPVTFRKKLTSAEQQAELT